MAYTKQNITENTDMTPAVFDYMEEGIKAAHNDLASHSAENAQALGFYSDLSAWYGNTKPILTFDSGGDAGVTFTGGAYNTTDFKVGNSSRGFANQTGGIIIASFAIQQDFSKFVNGESITDNDYLEVAVFLGGTLPTAIAIEFSTNNNGSSVDVNDFNAVWVTGLVPNQWNYLKMQRSLIGKTGNPNWNSIGYIRLVYSGGDTTTDCYFDALRFTKKDPLANYPNPFQRFGQRDFAINTGQWFVGVENGEIAWRDLEATASAPNSLVGYIPYTDKFTIRTIAKCLSYGFASTLGSIQFENSRVMIPTIEGNTLYLVATGMSTLSMQLPFTLLGEDRVVCDIERNGLKFTARAWKPEQPTLIATVSMDYINNGICYLQIPATYGGHITGLQSVSITTAKHARHADEAEKVNDKNVCYFKRGSAIYTDNDNSQTFSDAFCTKDSLVTVVITSATMPQGVWKVTSADGSFTITSAVAESADITFDYYIQRAGG